MILFAPASDVVTTLEMQKLASILKKARVEGGEVLLVIGHADPQGEPLDNVRLSWKRAVAVTRALEQLGQPRKQIRLLAAGPDWVGLQPTLARRAEILIIRNPHLPATSGGE